MDLMWKTDGGVGAWTALSLRSGTERWLRWSNKAKRMGRIG